MKAAIEVMRNKEMGKYRTSRVFNLPPTTLQSYVKDWQKSSIEAIKQNWVISKFFFVKEKIIWLSTVFRWGEMVFGLTVTDIMYLAY